MSDIKVYDKNIIVDWDKKNYGRDFYEFNGTSGHVITT